MSDDRIQQTQKTQKVRIFLAAPARDTAELRAVIEAEVQRIDRSKLAQRVIQVELMRWDDPANPIPMSWLRPPQEAVNHFTGGPSSCDLVIGVFRHVFGSELDATKFGTRTDGQRWACTEWELHCAVQAAKKGLVKDVLIFRDQSPLTQEGKSDEVYEAEEAELKRVRKFIAQARKDGCANRGVHDFVGASQLAEKFPGLLDGWLADYLTALERSPPPETPPSIEVAFDLRPYLQRRSEQWRTGAGGRLDRRFVNLKLMVDHGLAHEGPRHEVKGEYDLLATLLAERQDVGAWVLVGDPGSGKSTLLQHHEMTTAEMALAADAGAKPEVCVWRRLSEYSHDSPLPADWLALHWPDKLPPLPVLRGVARVRFLLDGLNEIKAPDREKQLEAIDRWTAWAAQQAHDAAGHHLAPIFSVRTLDQSPLSTNGFEVHQVVVARWTPDQIRTYCEHTLGEGNALWPVIADDKSKSLLDLSALPFNLWAQCELFRALGRVATDRAELMGGMFWQMLAQRVGDAPLKVAGLLGEPDRQRIANGKWKQTLRALPEKHGCLVPWLDETMQRLHRLGRQVSVAQDELLAGLEARPGWATPAQWLYAVRSLELIGEGGADEYSTDPLLRCTHQLWQEFFAARGLRELPSRAPERLPDLRPPALVPLDEVLAKLGVQEPLPGPDPSHWEEPVKLAVQLVRDPLAWVRALEPVNLALAGRAAVACQEKAEALHGAAVFDGLRQALLTRSRDAKVDLRLRIEAGLVLGDLGDPRYEKREGPHGRYLWPKQWVRIPAGTYTVGRTDGASDEGPVTEVTLDAYEMAWAPVTNAEFRCFVPPDGYDPQAPWWNDEAAQAWLAGGNDGMDGSTRQYLEVLGQIREHPQLMDGLTESERQYVQRHLPLSDEEVAAELLRERSEQPRDRPAFASDTRFNQAAQPVVGVCLFEVRAYAAWLSSQCGEEVRLPTEAEWEVAAASGVERRRWPHGDAEPDFDQVNHDQTHLWRTSPVGVFPRGDTRPESGGLTDMAGNVWEWTSSAYTERHDLTSLTTVCEDASARRVVRGGAWDNTTEHCRASYRSRNVPDSRSYVLGLRLVRRRRVPHSDPCSPDHRASDATPLR